MVGSVHSPNLEEGLSALDVRDQGTIADVPPAHTRDGSEMGQDWVELEDIRPNKDEELGR
jgi:hypothetical protein